MNTKEELLAELDRLRNATDRLSGVASRAEANNQTALADQIREEILTIQYVIYQIQMRINIL